jgi:aryl carrier-like protein
VDRKALPAPEYQAPSNTYVAPRTRTEEALAGIFADVLNVDRVGIHDNFFELGGHSLLAIALLERMRQVGLHVELRTLFSAPTLAALADEVSIGTDRVVVPPNGIPPGCEAVTPEMLPLVKLSQDEIDGILKAVPGGAANVQDIYPLAPLQEGILFHHLMSTDGDAYILSNLFSMDNRARLEDFVNALQAVMDRHDILRTAVVWEGLSEPVQVVWRNARLPVKEVVLDPTAGDVAEQLRARFDARHTRINVRQAPLMRAHIAYDEAQDRWLLLVLFHHLMGDHTTLEVIREEAQAHLLGRLEQQPAVDA